MARVRFERVKIASSEPTTPSAAGEAHESVRPGIPAGAAGTGVYFAPGRVSTNRIVTREILNGEKDQRCLATARGNGFKQSAAQFGAGQPFVGQNATDN